MKRRYRAATLFSLLFFSFSVPANGTDVLPAVGPADDGTLPALTAIAGRGMMDSPAYGYLTELSDNVGARVTGTPEGERAIEWGLAKMRSIGLENVRAESFSVWRGWTRISAGAELLAPVRRRLTWGLHN
jgi:hypothetical protein